MIRLRDLLQEKTAGEEAKQRGLKHVGWGRYADPSSGKVVAKSQDGRLVRLKQPEEPADAQRQKSGAVKEPKFTAKKFGSKVPKPKWMNIDMKSDIPEIPDKERMETATRIDKLNKITQKAKKLGKKAPDYNLCQITIPGTNLYCDDNLGIPREQMPQFKGYAKPGSKADKLPKGRYGSVDTEPMFRQMLQDKGIRVVQTEVPSDQLKATQSELIGSKVAGMAQALEDDPEHPGITAPIYVSRDGYVIDGHHRWAAITSRAIETGKPTRMPVKVIDMDVKDIIPTANEFAKQIGVVPKKAQAQAENKMIRLKDLLSEAERKKWDRLDPFPKEVMQLIKRYSQNDKEALKQITAYGKGEKIKSGKPKNGIWAYVWRMARFHSGIDPKMPVTADWDLSDGIEKETGWKIYFAVLTSDTKKILKMLDDQADRLLTQLPGVDKYGAARRWSGLI